MPWPNIQGAFQQQLAAKTWQCVNANGLSPGEAVMTEPLSVALHATKRVGNCLVSECWKQAVVQLVLSVIAALRAGASETIVMNTADNALSYALNEMAR